MSILNLKLVPLPFRKSHETAKQQTEQSIVKNVTTTKKQNGKSEIKLIIKYQLIDDDDNN